MSSLNLQDVQMLIRKRVPGADTPVVFLNKIERLKYMVSIDDDGLCRDVDDKLIDHTTSKGLGDEYFLSPYVMDKYGTLYFAQEFYRDDATVQYDKRHSTYNVVQPGCRSRRALRGMSSHRLGRSYRQHTTGCFVRHRQLERPLQAEHGSATRMCGYSSAGRYRHRAYASRRLVPWGSAYRLLG